MLTFRGKGKRENFRRIVDAIHSGSFNSVQAGTAFDYSSLTVDLFATPKLEDIEKLIDFAQENGVYLNVPSYNLLRSVYADEIQAEEQNAEQKQEPEPEQPPKIKATDIQIGDRFEYKGKEYEVTHLHGVYPDDVGVSYIDNSSTGLEYEETSNIDR